MNGQSLSWNEAKRLSGDTFQRRALVVDGAAADRESLKGLLDSAGFDVEVAASAREARDHLGRSTLLPDVVVLDPDLPDSDGIELVRDMAANGLTAIFVVSAGEDEELADRAYAAGATDFSYKPVVSRELLARLRKAVQDRRRSGMEAAPTRLALNREERTCILEGKTYSLTRHERDFLACLVDAPRHFATYERLIAAVWGSEHAVETQYLRVLAAQVRRKLENGRGGSPLIQTVVGEGMKLNN
jgi:two-component system, OmpR family, KDP operon response regulator KdpE